MQHRTYSALIALILSISACSSTPKDDSKPSEAESAATGPTAELASDMPKASTSPEGLQTIQNVVYALEDKIYGAKKLGTLGLYGELKNCRRKLASRQYGGSGDLLWTEPMDRVTAKESDVKPASPAEAQSQMARFRGYRAILQRRSDEYEVAIGNCKNDLSKRELDPIQSSKVMVTEVSKGSMDKTEVNDYLCQFVKKDASLRALMVELFAKGWLSLSDFAMEQNLIANSLKDSKGVSRENGMLFNGWKFAFDRGKVSVGDLLAGEKDAKLVAWTYGNAIDVKEHEKCLKSGAEWSP